MGSCRAWHVRLVHGYSTTHVGHCWAWQRHGRACRLIASWSRAGLGVSGVWLDSCRSWLMAGSRLASGEQCRWRVASHLGKLCVQRDVCRAGFWARKLGRWSATWVARHAEAGGSVSGRWSLGLGLCGGMDESLEEGGWRAGCWQAVLGKKGAIQLGSGREQGTRVRAFVGCMHSQLGHARKGDWHTGVLGRLAAVRPELASMLGPSLRGAILGLQNGPKNGPNTWAQHKNNTKSKNKNTK